MVVVGRAVESMRESNNPAGCRLAYYMYHFDYICVESRREGTDESKTMNRSIILQSHSLNREHCF